MNVDSVVADRYRVEKLIGSGNMGEVYRAYDLEQERLVALKRIHPHLVTDKDAILRFQREAKALSRLNHPGIVKFHGFHVEEGVYFIVLNYLDGQTLAERLIEAQEAHQPVPLEESKTIAIQLCEALAYAHRRQVIHRDLKPANVMISPQGHTILMDFGIARLLDGDHLTGDGLSPGTPGYMAPEIIRGRAVDGRSDLYTLGIILYEMVTGRRPFYGNSRYDTLHGHLFEPPPDVRQFNDQVPAELAAVIHKALAKEPADRFQSAEEMAQSLREQEGMAVTPEPIRKAAAPVSYIYPPTTLPTPQGAAALSTPWPIPAQIPEARPAARGALERIPILSFSLLILLFCLLGMVGLIWGSRQWDRPALLTITTVTPTTDAAAPGATPPPGSGSNSPGQVPTASTLLPLVNENGPTPTLASTPTATLTRVFNQTNTPSMTPTSPANEPPTQTGTTPPPTATPTVVNTPIIPATLTPRPTNTARPTEIPAPTKTDKPDEPPITIVPAPTVTPKDDNKPVPTRKS
ncbi:MAG: serine/threonine protein kinase [Anaerolineae bacterium]|nr:serine/threonine protein kinase [Anaerolineae bacterium]